MMNPYTVKKQPLHQFVQRPLFPLPATLCNTGKILPLRESASEANKTVLEWNFVGHKRRDFSVFYSDAYEKNTAFFSIITSHLTVIICLHISLALNFKTPEYSV